MFNPKPTISFLMSVWWWSVICDLCAVYHKANRGRRSKFGRFYRKLIHYFYKYHQPQIAVDYVFFVHVDKQLAPRGDIFAKNGSTVDIWWRDISHHLCGRLRVLNTIKFCNPSLPLVGLSLQIIQLLIKVIISLGWLKQFSCSVSKLIFQLGSKDR